MGLHLGLLFVANMVLSKDMGVSLIFVFIFLVMAFTGGVSYLWFLAGIAFIAIAFPILWPMLGEYQQLRIAVIFDPSLDPNKTGVLWQSNLSLRTLTGGGMTGQGLFNGHRTQNVPFEGQHTDFIFATVGEELGYVGCIAVLLLIGLIIAIIMAFFLSKAITAPIQNLTKGAQLVASGNFASAVASSQATPIRT